MSVSYQVDYVLSMTRLPRRFYAMINKLEGHDAIYQNPAISVQSYVIANAINNEIVIIPPHLIDNVMECEAFSTSKEILAKINESLIQVCTQLIGYITSQPSDVRNYMFDDISETHELAKTVKSTFDAFMMTQNQNTTYVEISTMLGITYKQSLFDIQDKIEFLSHKLEKINQIQS